MTYEAGKIRLVMELRRAGITDNKVLSAIERCPRELFVPETFRDRAYENIALPIAQGQTISQPYVVAFMTMQLRVSERMRVLEVGTGSGYQAAILSLLVKRVFTVERYRTLLEDAEAVFRQLKLTNIMTRRGDGYKGWPEIAPFPRIIVTAGADDVPAALADQLDEDDGQMLIPVGPREAQSIVRVTRQDGEFKREELLPVRFVPLVEGLPRDGV
ncbi:MAG: protein-L-isoaspartate(D-aspartate) O-methyltransferase [Alphaproteobacteria bacterium]